MIKILITDDERPIREWFNMILDSLSDEFELEVITAIDGVDGYEKYLYQNPDMVITDIKMPHSDGINLLTKIKEHNTATYVIMLTSYSNFNYAVQSLNKKANEYILKTEVTKETIRQSILKYKKLNGKSSEKKTTQYLEELLRNPQVIKQYDSPTSGINIAISYNNSISKTNILELQPINHIISIKTLAYNEQISVIIISLDIPNLPISIYKHINDYMENLVSLHGFSVGLSSTNTNTLTCIQEATEAIKIAFYSRLPKIYVYEENINHRENEIIKIKNDEIQKLYFHTEDTILRKVVCEIIEYSKKIKFTNIDFLKSQIIDIVQVFKMSLVSIINYDFEMNFNELNDVIMSAKDYLIIEEHLNELLTTLPKKNIISDKSPYIEPIIQYIEENYNSISSVKEIADIVNLNSDYFCRMFKDNFGMTFIDYLTQFRIEKAKKLLAKTDIPITEIPFDIGYNSITYFTRVFKKKVGTSPSEYRLNS